jgi:ferredoxin
VDAGACIGCGMCAALAPEWFTLDGAHSTAASGDVEENDILLDAADSCPEMAITVTEGGVVVGPRP